MTAGATAEPSTTERSRALVRGLYDAAVGGDLPTVLGLLHPDVEVHEPAFLPYGGVYRGHQGFLELFGRIAQLFDVGAIRIDYLLADGDRVIGAIRMTDLSTGGDVLLLEQSTVVGERVTEMRIFFHDTQSMITTPGSAG